MAKREPKDSHLTDAEFLGRYEELRLHSPVIDALCIRLESKKGFSFQEEDHVKADCPVCEAELMVEYDEGNHRFELTTD